MSIPANTTAAGAAQKSAMLPPMITEYLTERGWLPDDTPYLQSLGVEPITQHVAETRVGLPVGSLAKWSEFIWLPGREPSGQLHSVYGNLLVFREVQSFTRRIERERLTPSGERCPQRATFFGDGWYDYTGEFAVCESWLKAALVHARLDIPTIALSGVYGFIAESKKSIVEHFDRPPWSRNATAVICYDSPNRTSPESEQNIRQAEERLAHLLRESASVVKATRLPTPPDTRVGWGVDDFYSHGGLPALQHLFRTAPPLATATTTQHVTLNAGPEIAQRQPGLWIVKDLVPADELMNIVGPTSCGKTFLALDLMLAVARGSGSWFGKRIKCAGLVVHITLEGTGLPRRLQAYTKHHKLTAADLAAYQAIETPINIRDAETVQRIIRAVQERETATGRKTALICVDTVNRALGAGDENSSKDMGEYLRAAEQLKAAFPGCTVISVHHMGKNESKGARGHSSFTANPGAELWVDDDSGLRTVTIRKMRDGAAGWSFHFQLDVVGVGRDEDNEEITSCVVQSHVNVPDPTLARHEALYELYKDEPVTANAMREAAKKLQQRGIKTSVRDLKALLPQITEKVGAPSGAHPDGVYYKVMPPRASKY